ncbi:DNA binding domain, excisionase family [Mycobacteroides abscessus subsp. massiliense]|uniref:helix-turn-helix domain-containing protein n=1 Tax=Mycobacteroides abscessus TaxID=36809 RepID=UPI00092987B5|nr:helix-turn-helix domain-containing protein [Mycobacteroides abscessus]SHR63509.1 DNA binding domain, excisionase family [Mycobacteroides abscessus subsp. abscessus]SKG49280.1 DNA binding domain, excisionase family [Mycobacteroides abscessus subsp. massiliense]SKH00751.1 DNA binding domain, excisionase family [Mycobacteroides abscessus subsp. massiliense]SKH98095.1 DNA binding domain, excisionase family [Mycobacteroides abscessus subsp. massiliense]SKJ26778.1 DNA binding domain, excisionase 
MTEPTAIAVGLADDTDEILSPETGADYLKISLPTFMDLIKTGQLRAARVGRQWRIRKVWIYEFLDNSAASAA